MVIGTVKVLYTSPHPVYPEIPIPYPIPSTHFTYFIQSKLAFLH